MIYLLEDDDSIRDFVIYTLNSQGLEARGFDRPSAFWAALEAPHRCAHRPAADHHADGQGHGVR